MLKANRFRKIRFNMRSLHRLVWFWLAPIIFSLSVFFAPLQTARAEIEDYFPPEKIDAIALLAPPPLPGSAEQAADLAEVRSVHWSHPASEEAIALMENTNLSWTDFSSVFGCFSQPGNLPKTELFFKRVLRDTGSLVTIAKNHWKRERPYVIDPSLAQGEPTPGFSYPSGHSTIGTVYALILAEMFPEKREAILAIGRNLGWHRVILAKHYPTDVVAGRVLGQAIVRELNASPEFQHDLHEVRAEISAHE